MFDSAKDKLAEVRAEILANLGEIAENPGNVDADDRQNFLDEMVGLAAIFEDTKESEEFCKAVGVAVLALGLLQELDESLAVIDEAIEEHNVAIVNLKNEAAFLETIRAAACPE